MKPIGPMDKEPAWKNPGFFGGQLVWDNKQDVIISAVFLL